MGIYINPRNGYTKEQWLEQYGMKLSPPYKAQLRSFDFTNNSLPVCLVDNGGNFTAAAIGYNQDEVDRFLDSVACGDIRPMTWYVVDKRHLREYFPAGYII